MANGNLDLGQSLQQLTGQFGSAEGSRRYLDALKKKKAAPPGGASMLGLGAFPAPTTLPQTGPPPTPTTLPQTGLTPTATPFQNLQVPTPPGGAVMAGSSPTTESRGFGRFEDRGPVMDEAGMQQGFGGEYTGLRTATGREPMTQTEAFEVFKRSRPDLFPLTTGEAGFDPAAEAFEIERTRAREMQPQWLAELEQIGGDMGLYSPDLPTPAQDLVASIIEQGGSPTADQVEEAAKEVTSAPEGLASSLETAARLTDAQNKAAAAAAAGPSSPAAGTGKGPALLTAAPAPPAVTAAIEAGLGAAPAASAVADILLSDAPDLSGIAPGLKNILETAYETGAVPDMTFLQNVTDPGHQFMILENILSAIQFGKGEQAHAADRALQERQLTDVEARTRLETRGARVREREATVEERLAGVQETRAETDAARRQLEEDRLADARFEAGAGRLEAQLERDKQVFMQERQLLGEEERNIRDIEQRGKEVDARVTTEADRLGLDYERLTVQERTDLNEQALTREVQEKQRKSDQYIARLQTENQLAIAQGRLTSEESARQLDREIAMGQQGIQLADIAARQGIATAELELQKQLANKQDYVSEKERNLQVWLQQQRTSAADADRTTNKFIALEQLKQQQYESTMRQALGEAEIKEAGQARKSKEAISTAEMDLQRELAMLGLDERQQDRIFEETTAREERALERERMALEREASQRQAETQMALAALQDPFNAAAFARMTGGGLPGAVPPLPGGMTDFGFQNVPVPAQGVGQFFPGGIPTVGALGQATPESLQFLNALLGYSGVSPGQFGRAASGITPQVAQGPGMRMVGAGQPMGVRA